MTPAEQTAVLNQIHESICILRQRVPLVEDYLADLMDLSDELEAMIEATDE
jgi:hypothetical protein